MNILQAYESIPEIQNALLQILKIQFEEYTDGESTSLPKETVEELLHSILYVVSIGAKNEAITASQIPKFYEEGNKILKKRVFKAMLLYRNVSLSFPSLSTQSMIHSLQSIGTGFKYYKVKRFAHIFIADINYQLANPIDETVKGIDYILLYLNALRIENHFLNRIPLQSGKKVLQKWYTNYEKIPLNLFEPLCIQAIGCVLCDKDSNELVLSEEDIEQLNHLFKMCSVEQVLTSAIEKMAINPDESKYMMQIIPSLSARIETANTLNYIFYVIL